MARSIEKRVRLVGTYHPESEVSQEIITEVASHATERKGSKVRLLLTLSGLEIKHSTGIFKSREKGLSKTPKMYVPFAHISTFFVCLPKAGAYPCLLCHVVNEGINTPLNTSKLIAFLCYANNDAKEFLDVFMDIRRYKNWPEPSMNDSNWSIRREKTNSIGSRSSSGRLQGHERAALEQHNGGTRVQHLPPPSSSAEQNQNSNASSSHKFNGNTKENGQDEPVYAIVNKNKSKKKTAPQYGSHGDLKKAASKHERSRKTSSHHEMENGLGKSTPQNSVHNGSKKRSETSMHSTKIESRKSTSHTGSSQDERKINSSKYDSNSDLMRATPQHDNLVKVSGTNGVAHDLPNGISSERTSNRDTISSTSEIGLHHNMNADFQDSGNQTGDKIDIRGKIEYLTEEIEQLKHMLEKDEPGKQDIISNPYPQHQSQHRSSENHVTHATSNVDLSDRTANHLIHSPRAQAPVSYDHSYTLPRASGAHSSKTFDGRKSEFVDGKARLVIGNGRELAHSKRMDPVAAGPIYVSGDPAFTRQTGVTRHSSLKYDGRPQHPGSVVIPVEHVRTNQPVSPVLASISETMYAPYSQPGMSQSATLTRPHTAHNTSNSNVHLETYDTSKGAASPRSVNFENNLPTYKRANTRPKSMTHYDANHDTVAKPIEQVYSRTAYPTVHVSRPNVIYAARPHMTSPPTIPPPSYHEAHRYSGASGAPVHMGPAQRYNFREHEPKPS